MGNCFGCKNEHNTKRDLRKPIRKDKFIQNWTSFISFLNQLLLFGQDIFWIELLSMDICQDPKLYVFSYTSSFYSYHWLILLLLFLI